MLNYTVPPFQFLVGSFDASEYLDSISLSVPMHELGQTLLWSGQFTISNNLAAQIAGLTDADFSEFTSPGRWRPYQQLVRLNIKGYQSPAFRIEDYRYNAQTRTGEGRLTQIPTAVAGDRPGEEIPTEVSGVIQAAISNLITAAFRGATVIPGRSLHVDNGVLDIPLSTRNPWADAVRLSSLSWHWLTVNAAESIVSVPGDGTLIFSWTAEQVELVPDLAAIYQSANQVIVTGARQVLDESVNNPSAQPPSAPRPKFKTTKEYRPFTAVFPQESTLDPILFEEKTIIYQYWDDETFADLPDSGSISNFLYDIQSQAQSGISPFSRPPANLATPLQTITMKRQPFGYLFPSVGVVTGLIPAEVIIESSLRKLTLKPKGVISPALGTVTALDIDKRETLTSDAIPPGSQLTIPKQDANGQSQAYELRPNLEPLQPIATRPLKTEVLKGTANLSPIGWNPILKTPLVVDFGFLPDQSRAEILAQKLAMREQRRRDQVLVDMPIPDEWLAAGWPLLGRCQIGGDVYLMDGCALSISDGEAKFGFTGGLVSKSGLALFAIQVDLPPEIVFDCDLLVSIGADVVPSIQFELELGSVVVIELFAEQIIDAVVASSGGDVIDSGIMFEAIITSSVLQTLNITVSPTTLPEGT